MKKKTYFKIIFSGLINFFEKKQLKLLVIIFFTKNILVKIVALLGAFFLFAYLKSSNIEELMLSVPLRVNLPPRTILTSDIITRVNVTYTGRKSSIASLDVNFLYAEINPIKIDKKHLVGVKAKGHLENIKIKKIDPENVRLTIAKMQRKKLEIKPEFVGNPGKDFILSDYNITPKYIWVDGPKSIIKELSYLRTTPVSLKGLISDKEIESEISQTTHPQLIFHKEQKYTIKIKIAKESKVTASSKEYLISFKNVTSNLTNNDFRISDYSDALKISNVQYINESTFSPKIVENRLHFYVDCNRITNNGNYQLPIEYQRFSNVFIEFYQPNFVNINITNFYSFDETGKID